MRRCPARESGSIPGRGYAFMKAHRAEFPLAAMCWVSPPAATTTGSSVRPRRARDETRELEARIGSIWTGSGETYGRPRIHAALRDEGERVSQKHVGQLMRGLGIEGATRRRFKTATTKRDTQASPAPDLVNRDFSASGLDQLWVADITYVPTWAGRMYLAIVLDVWSRRVVGSAMATHMRTELVEAALPMALRTPTMPTTGSDKRIGDSGACRSPWRSGGP